MDRVLKIIIAIVAVIVILVAGIRLLGLASSSGLISGHIPADTSSPSDVTTLEDTGAVSFRHPLTEEEIADLISRYDFGTDRYYYYGTLTGEEKKAYSILYDCVNRADTEVLWGSSIDITDDQVMTVINAIYLDHPELFWMENGASYSYGPKNRKVITVQPKYNELVNDLDNNRLLFANKANEILADARQEASNGIVFQEASIHDSLCDCCEYDENAVNNQSAFSCLVSGRSVCSGYARAFQYLMNELGITTYYVTGRSILSDNNVAHGWNVVMIGGRGYNVDVTWDDDVGTQLHLPVHAFFNVTDSQLSESHQRDELALGVPQCVSEDLSYDKTIGDTPLLEDLIWT